jgi:tetratricopeptide (TPR) repeat protein
MGSQATLSEAVHCIKAGLQMNSLSSGAWNTLGVLTFSLNPRLSQHAFIRSVELVSKNHVAWTNLGFFYVIHSDLDLANEAFERAQLVDPDWALSWMGKALIASLNGHQQKAGKLVEHAYTLSLGSIVSKSYSFFLKKKKERRKLMTNIFMNVECLTDDHRILLRHGGFEDVHWRSNKIVTAHQHTHRADVGG